MLCTLSVLQIRVDEIRNLISRNLLITDVVNVAVRFGARWPKLLYYALNRRFS